ncbi:hypothetical protein BJ165DRAFT_866259 [Panaeolus papilionaceus]|nr:hypothetical protein BJ165DRAFT_866259 [Panaeolus papilionaceus]
MGTLVIGIIQAGMMWTVDLKGWVVSRIRVLLQLFWLIVSSGRLRAILQRLLVRSAYRSIGPDSPFPSSAEDGFYGGLNTYLGECYGFRNQVRKN